MGSIAVPIREKAAPPLSVRASEQSTPVIIAVMGMTGSGKSTFIHIAGALAWAPRPHGGEGHPEIGGSLTSYLPARYAGFDDTFVSDREIVKRIAEYLVNFFEKKNNVTGILYLHSITGVRMVGSALKNVNMFRKLVGAGNMSNCRLVTTMWSKVDAAIAAQRVVELATDKNFWQPMIEKGIQIVRFQDCQQSAPDITAPLLERGHSSLRSSTSGLSRDEAVSNRSRPGSRKPGGKGKRGP